MFRCLSGELPFDEPTAAGVLLKVVQMRAPSLRERCRELPSNLAIAIDRALEPSPALRYADMRSFARALAVACVRDGVALPVAPDPVGLPDFAAWLSADGSEKTTRLPSLPAAQQSVEPAAHALKSTQVSRATAAATRPAIRRSVLAALALMTAGASVMLARDAPPSKGTSERELARPQAAGIAASAGAAALRGGGDWRGSRGVPASLVSAKAERVDRAPDVMTPAEVFAAESGAAGERAADRTRDVSAARATARGGETGRHRAAEAKGRARDRGTGRRPVASAQSAARRGQAVSLRAASAGGAARRSQPDGPRAAAARDRARGNEAARSRAASKSAAGEATGRPTVEPESGQTPTGLVTQWDW